MLKFWTKKYTVSTLLTVALATLIVSAAVCDVTATESVFKGGKENSKEYFGQEIRLWGSNGYPEDASYLGRMFKLKTGNTYFALWCDGSIDTNTGAWTAKGVGEYRPSTANWYAGGFYDVVVGGKSIFKSPATVIEVKGGKSEGHVKLSWQHPDATVTADFVLRDGDDKLLIKTNVETKSKISGYTVRLRSYPGSLAGGWEPGLRTRDREALTAGKVLQREQKENNAGKIDATLDAGEPWVLFYDKYYDMAQNRGEGPCAFAYSPKQVSSAKVMVGNYNCDAYLTYPAGNLTSDIVIWDFHGMTNESAKEYMKKLEIKPAQPSDN